MLLFFHAVFPAAPVYILLFIGLVIAPCLSGIAVYRLFLNQISRTAIGYSIISVIVFSVVSYTIYVYVFVGEIEISALFYCLTFPFGFVFSIGTLIATNNPAAAILIGIIVNLTAMIGFVSFIENKIKKFR